MISFQLNVHKPCSYARQREKERYKMQVTKGNLTIITQELTKMNVVLKENDNKMLRTFLWLFFSLSSKMLTRMLRTQSEGDTEMDQNVCDVLGTIYKSLSCHVTTTTGIHLPPTA